MGVRSYLERHGGPWLFVALFVAMCGLFEYGRVMHQRPFPHHLSRQTAALSFTHTYWSKGNDLFDPQLQHLAADGLTTGRTVAEFPILYYAMAQLWRLTGPSEFAYRAFMLLLHFTASLALFLTLRRILRAELWAVLVSLFFFTVPAVVYFAISFMPDVPAFDLMLLGCWALFRSWPEQRKRDLVLASILFALAGLLKLPALMAPLTLLVLWTAENVLPSIFVRGRAVIQHRWTGLFLLLGVLVVNAAWYRWSNAYVEEHRFPFSHSGTWALWDLTDEQIDTAWKGGTGVMVWQLFDTPAWIMLGALLLFLITQAPHVPRTGWLALLTLMGGVTLFTLLWFITLDAHEYYFIIPLLLPLVLIVLSLSVIRTRFPRAFGSPWLLAAFALLFVYHAVYAGNNHRMRTRVQGGFDPKSFLPIYHPEEAHFWDMAQYWALGPCLRMKPYLRSIGITDQDRILLPTDKTVCASLYLLGHEGWVGYGLEPFDQAALEARERNGARYFIYHKDHFVVEPWLEPYLDRPVGAFEGMLIFKL
ncbi:MAG: hypothetical protein E6Q44_11720 [Flavobacteriales bacterium]|nr:MAG: hypothetical protein E6Q44_11720 [Flavobacteriales bacterium]